ncbi:uncharacterized protein N0V89_000151 [Didymosphaeria variabile]|uniref:Uncharacterized protein n=1 Tax=Didymosphaeria variabile TaxID=1932322 RepID=A0A9W8XUP7_9PLEO|nr:uncharacterized protein N0V89_000151 [Didymosphaeria variabile]KAJ4359596.1 hypothetical protein N0V89_000151 [Didymosphaeria variabile]
MPARPKPRPTLKPKPKPTPSKPKPEPTVSKSASKHTATPTQAKNKWPMIRVPYQTTAFDVCGLFVECGEENEALAVRDVNVEAMAMITEAPMATPTASPSDPNGHEHQNEKRDIRTYPVTFAKGNVFTMTNLDYPSAPQLFNSPAVDRNVFTYKSNKMEDAAVKNIKRIPTAQEMVDYVTEHIVELQSIALFIKDVTSKDKSLVTFFKNRWHKALPANTVTSRPHKPHYYTEGMTTRNSLNDLIFEALGSDNNLHDFVMCEDSINSFKMRMWKGEAPMALTTYNDAVTAAMKGQLPSSAYMSALRGVVAVYRYMSDPQVKSRMNEAITNVEIELQNVQHLTGTNLQTNLAKAWRTYMRDRVADIGTDGKKWLQARIDHTRPQVVATLTKYQGMLKNLKHKETTGTQAQINRYAAQQNQEKTRLTREIAQAQSDVTRQEGHIVTVRGQVAALTAQIRPATGTREKQLKADRQRKRNELLREKTKLVRLKKALGKVTRERDELYSNSVQQIVDNLQKDQKLLNIYERAIARLSMPVVHSGSTDDVPGNLLHGRP